MDYFKVCYEYDKNVSNINMENNYIIILFF